MLKMIVKHKMITDCEHHLKTSGLTGGDSSQIEIEFYDNSGGSAVEVKKTKSGYKLIYTGDDEGLAFVNALEIFLLELRKHYKSKITNTEVFINYN